MRGDRLVTVAGRAELAHQGQHSRGLGVLFEACITVALSLRFQVLQGIAGALPDDLPLPLTHTRQQIHHQPACRCRGVEAFLQADQWPRLFSRTAHEGTEVLHAAGEAIELVDDHDIDVSGLHHGEQPR